MNEFLVKLIQNARNGGGNPYHDEKGRFTNGPSSAFGKFKSNSKTTKKDIQDIGFYVRKDKFNSSLSYKNIDALIETNKALDNIYNSAADLEDKNHNGSYSEFYEMTYDIKNRINDFVKNTSPDGGLLTPQIQRFVSETKQLETRIKGLTSKFKNTKEQDVKDMVNATKAAINTFKYIQDKNLDAMSWDGIRTNYEYSVSDFE